ncbi:MAG: hypothetical protein CVV27_02725 [Candidatus Melainabacteria bacterium HGW-Melainabacteria-1]|nr:MAG: hypothetical protein CVV27_02725 [Candidatus Melainabacteria bacterium HGW-Melainabacteria-1]
MSNLESWLAGLTRQTLKMALCFSLSGSLLISCGPLTHSDALKDIDREIKTERARQELERLRQQNQPSPSPSVSAEPAAERPFANNQPPRLTQLEARLRTSVTLNDTVELVADAVDPDGDPVEFTWASVFTGLSATRGQTAVWFPGDQQLAGRTNLITLTVSDKKGGTSTGTLNVFVQNDGTLLVRQNLAAQPVLAELEISRPDPGQLRLKARGLDPAGGTVRYSWKASKGLLGSSSTDTATWSARGDEMGEIVISLELSNGDGTARTQLDYRFNRNADGSLSGDFRTIRSATALEGPSPNPSNSSDSGVTLATTLYGISGDKLVSTSLSTGRQLELSRLNQFGVLGTPRQMLFDGLDTLYLLGNGLQAFSLSRLESSPVSVPAGVMRLFRYQGQACGLVVNQGRYSAYVLASGQALSLKNPEWLSQGAIGSQGLVGFWRNGTVQVSDPARGIQQAWLDLEGSGESLFWHPDGRRLAVFSGRALHLLGLDGSREQVAVRYAPTQAFWLNERAMLIFSGKDAAVLDPGTGVEQPLNSNVSSAVANLSLIEPGL